MDVIEEKLGVASGRMNIFEIATFFQHVKNEAARLEREKMELGTAVSRLQGRLDSITECLNRIDREWEIKNEYGYMLRELLDCDDDDTEENSPCYVYYILNEEKDKVKIGISNNPISRAKNIQTACGEEIELYHTIKFENREQAERAERFLHTEYSLYRKRPSKVAKSSEWFDATILQNLVARFDTAEKILTAEKEHETEVMRQMMAVKINIC